MGMLLFIALFGVALLCFGSYEKEEKQMESSEEVVAYEAYRLAMEEAAEGLCRQVKGVGQVQVCITLSQGEVVTYSGTKITSTTPPVVGGVAVVCEGGGSDRIKQEVTELLSALFHVGANRIHVSPMK